VAAMVRAGVPQSARLLRETRHISERTGLKGLLFAEIFLGNFKQRANSDADIKSAKAQLKKAENELKNIGNAIKRGIIAPTTEQTLREAE
jgi:hypothetical protein